MNFLKSLISETNGTPSSLRVSFLVWEIVLVASFILIVGYTIYSHYTHKDIFNPSTILTWVASIFAANRGSKLIQKPFESDSLDDDDTDTPVVTPSHPPQLKDL
jgi:hypothetical protein